MKKFILTVTLAALGLSSMAQGLIAFQNGATTRYFTNTLAQGGTRGALALTPNSFVVALFYYDITANGMAGSSNLNNYVFATSVFNSAVANGQILGNGNLALTGSPGGDAVSVFTLAYSAAEGGGTNGWSIYFNRNTAIPGTTTGWSAPGGMYGMSPIAYGGAGTGIVLGTVPSPGTPMYSNAAGLIGTVGGGTDLLAVPEPSTFALAGLGAAAMLIFRRRK